MNSDLFPDKLDQRSAQELSVQAGRAFQPRSPISAREFFAGRWEHLTSVADAVFQKGLHIVIFGERGVGKTSLANVIEPLLQVMEESLTGKHRANARLVAKVNAHEGDEFGSVWRRAFDEVFWDEDHPSFGLSAQVSKERVTLRSKLGISDNPSIDDVRRTLSLLKGCVFIFDEFDRGSAKLRTSFTDLIKALSDYAVDATVVIVGVSETVDDLVRGHASIVRSIVQVQLPRMNERELREILDKACNSLSIVFDEDAASLIVRMSQGLPHYTHLIGLHSTREAANRLSRRVSSKDVVSSFPKAVNQALQSIREKYLHAIRSAHKDALYDKVLFACASASAKAKDALGYFHPSDVVGPLRTILGRDTVTIATFQKHINELCEKKRGPVLGREGMPRSFKYRFHDPLLPPYIFMNAVAANNIDLARLTEIMSESA